MGEGVLSGIAKGCGAGRAGALGMAFLMGVGSAAGFGAGGTGSGLGKGGSTNCDNSSAGTKSSAARISRPLCSAQISPMCSATTATAITALRLKGGLTAASTDPAESPREGKPWGEGGELAFIGPKFSGFRSPERWPARADQP